MSSIFERRDYLKPYEYPDLIQYSDAVRHSYWLHTEFQYSSDITDYKSRVSEPEREAIKRAMLAIAQIEVAVKSFWGNLYNHIPKPEIGAVGFTFAESEVRHMDAYSHLLEILGLNSEFKKLHEVPCIEKRINYLNKVLEKAKTTELKDYSHSIMLFSLFIEHISLFSQFLIILSYNKHRNLFKGMSNAVEATSKEEQIHGLFGIDLINIIKEEKPEWFDKEYEIIVKELSMEAYQAELEIIDWIFEKGELSFVKKDEVIEFIKHRFNKSMRSIGLEPIFVVDEKLLLKTDWFDTEIISTKHTDFFYKRSINYNKRSQSVTSTDLF